MLRHTLKQIFRNLRKHKSYTLINLLGLSLGIAATVLIFLIADYELSFDRLHSATDSLYRVVRKTERAEKVDHQATVPYPTGRLLRQEYPGVLASQIHFAGSMGVRIGSDAPFQEENLVFADSLFLQVLDFGAIEGFWVAGNRGTALSNPGQAILTEGTAKRYFGSENPLGKRIRLDNTVDVEVVGIVKDVPVTNHLPFNLLISYATLSPELMLGHDPSRWDFTASGYTYLRLDEQTNKATTESALQAIENRNAYPDRNSKSYLSLQPLADIHFDPTYENSNETYTISPKYLSMLLLLGGFILLIACVNYINLSTSLAFTKAKEVGIRKTIGASKGQLFVHYMLETLVVTVCATLLGIALSVVFLPIINQILGKSMTTAPLLEPALWMAALGGILFIAFISGAYPALILAGFNPISSLKNKMMMPGTSSVFLRKALVVFQFTTSIGLIICTLVISRQMHYFQNKPLGFDKEAVVEVRLPESNTLKQAQFRNLLQNRAGIGNITYCLGAPISKSGIGTALEATELPQNDDHAAWVIPCDSNYLETYKLELLAGRWLLPSEVQNIGSAVVVNRTLAKTMGYTDPKRALGKTIKLGLNDITPTIIGVVEDFHTTSLHSSIEPVALTPFPYFHLAAGIRLVPGDTKNTLATIEKAWREVYPEGIYQMKFIDEELAERYEQETRDYQLFKAFSLISIFICCIGLWGLIAFVVVRKTKEIGIRKVLGATISSIVLLISHDFLKLIGIALLLASAIAWYFMDSWLQDFAYRIHISWWIFALAGGFALLIAFVTISFQAIKAALSNPVRNLRTE